AGQWSLSYPGRQSHPASHRVGCGCELTLVVGITDGDVIQAAWLCIGVPTKGRTDGRAWYSLPSRKFVRSGHGAVQQRRRGDRVADQRVAPVDLEVQVRPGREARAALEADQLAGVHERTIGDRDPRQQVRVADEVRLRRRVAGQAGDELDVDVVPEPA